MNDPRPPAEPDEPCRCLNLYAAISPTHLGHCCFIPATRTCHPDEVAAWRAKAPRGVAR